MHDKPRRRQVGPLALQLALRAADWPSGRFRMREAGEVAGMGLRAGGDWLLRVFLHAGQVITCRMMDNFIHDDGYGGLEGAYLVMDRDREDSGVRVCMTTLPPWVRLGKNRSTAETTIGLQPRSRRSACPQPRQFPVQRLLRLCFMLTSYS